MFQENLKTYRKAKGLTQGRSGRPSACGPADHFQVGEGSFP